MSQYNIAWLPGDGVGVEVMEAAKLCLDALKFEATYTHGDIGWEFWRKEGEAFPQRTIDLLKQSHAAMVGAITSKPVKEAEAELAPELKGRGLIYRSPIVRMRQMFDLFPCLRPCKAYPGNPLNYKEGMFLETGKRIAKEYPGVQMDDANVDAITMWMLKNPKNYGVMVATNLFGDIISDLAAQMVGGLGFGCSGNIGEKLAVFEPSH